MAPAYTQRYQVKQESRRACGTTDEALLPYPVADPGFPVGGVDLRCRYFSMKMYAKTKELDPVGGMRPACPLDPPMVLVMFKKMFHFSG